MAYFDVPPRQKVIANLHASFQHALGDSVRLVCREVRQELPRQTWLLRFSRVAKSCAKLLAGCIVFCDSDSCAKLHADGVTKSCAKLRKPISRNHCPTRHTRPTRPTSLSASREAQSLALHCSLQIAKLCEMGLCAPCRGAPTVVLRFSCQRSNWLIPLPLSKCASTPSKRA